MNNLTETDLEFLYAFQWDIERDIEELEPLLDRFYQDKNVSGILERAKCYLKQICYELRELTGSESDGTS